RVGVGSVRACRIVGQCGQADGGGRRPGCLHTPDGPDLLTTAQAQRLPQVRSLLMHHPPRARHVPATGGAPPASVTLASAPYRLPAPVQREVAVVSGGGVIIVGGLNTAKVSTNGVFRLGPSAGRVRPPGAGPKAFHDAAEA